MIVFGAALSRMEERGSFVLKAGQVQRWKQ
jgi:hypothetical protein